MASGFFWHLALPPTYDIRQSAKQTPANVSTMAKKSDLFFPDRIVNGQLVTPMYKQTMRELEGHV